VLRSAAVYRCNENLTREHAGTQNPSKRLEPLTPRHSHTPDDLNPQHHRCEEFQNELSMAKTCCWSGRFSNALRVLSSSGFYLTFTLTKGYSTLTKCLHTRKQNTIRGQTTIRPTGVFERVTFQNNVLTCMSKAESGTGKVLSEMSFQLLIFPYGKVSSQKLTELTD